MIEQFFLLGTEFTAYTILTEHGKILLLQGRKANLGCGYFSLAPAEKLNDRFAVCTGVSSIEDLLNAPVKAASPAALACGVTPGMTGGEALKLMEK